MDTGEVLDYVVKSKSCFECHAHSRWSKDSEWYKSWYMEHENNCVINHALSAESLEKQAAMEAFLHLIHRHKLKYVTYVGDGDSSSFGEASDALFEKYGEE